MRHLIIHPEICGKTLLHECGRNRDQGFRFGKILKMLGKIRRHWRADIQKSVRTPFASLSIFSRILRIIQRRADYAKITRQR